MEFDFKVVQCSSNPSFGSQNLLIDGISFPTGIYSIKSFQLTLQWSIKPMLYSWSPSSKTYLPSKSGQTSNLPSSSQKSSKHRKNDNLSVETVIKRSKVVKYPLKASTDNNSFNVQQIPYRQPLFLKKSDPSPMFLPTSQSPEPIGSKPGSVTSTSTYLLLSFIICCFEVHLTQKAVKAPSNPLRTPIGDFHST